MPPPSQCPICAREGSVAAARLYDDRHAYVGYFDLFRCSTCGHRWLDWLPDESTLTTLYTDYYPRSSRSTDDLRPLKVGTRLGSWWNGRRSSVALWIPPNVRVLDIGCGFGESLAFHRHRGCDVEGVEIDHNIARVAERYGFRVRVGAFDPGAYEPSSFDYVTMDQVLEHAIDPLTTLRGIRTILRPGGSLMASTPNASGLGAHVFRHRWIHWHAPYHLHFFSRDSLEHAAARTGFEVRTIETVTSSEWLNYQWIHLMTAPKPANPSRFWSPRGRVPLGVKSLRAFHRLGFDHVLTRVCDALGLGDNFVASLVRKEHEGHE